MSHNIYHNLVIKSTKEQVFKAITEPKHLNNWWTLKASGEPTLNTEYNLHFTDLYDWYGKVTEVQYNEVFCITMTKSDPDWDNTTFGFHLKTVENGTQLDFAHKNWSKNNDHYRHSSFCWAMLLNGLKNYLEKGTVVPFENRN
jgi:uncharacterized protein YndB with AHSA1/START domain